MAAPTTRPVPPVPPGWHALATVVPRKDQVVRILTDRGVDHAARFVVMHTNEWPSGAWWSLVNGNATLPFPSVLAWSPDAEARPPLPGAPGPAPAESGAPPGLSPRPALVNEVLAEVGQTGNVLRLVPRDLADWTPHADVPPLRVLSWRLVRIVARIGWILELDSIELSFEPDVPYARSVDDTLATYFANELTVTEVAAGITPEALRAPWRLERNGELLVEMPRGDAVRTFGLSPLVYHRGEAGLLLTALGVRVPHPYPLWAFRERGQEASWSAPPDVR